jgi:hypothetical protein
MSDYILSQKETILENLETVLASISSTTGEYRYDIMSVTREPIDLTEFPATKLPALQILNTDSEVFGDLENTLTIVITGVVKFDRDIAIQSTLLQADILKRLGNCMAELGPNVRYIFPKSSDSAYFEDAKNKTGLYFALEVELIYVIDWTNP